VTPILRSQVLTMHCTVSSNTRITSYIVSILLMLLVWWRTADPSSGLVVGWHSHYVLGACRLRRVFHLALVISMQRNGGKGVVTGSLSPVGHSGPQRVRQGSEDQGYHVKNVSRIRRCKNSSKVGYGCKHPWLCARFGMCLDVLLQ